MEHLAHQEDLQKLNSLMKEIKFVMLTTVEENGSLHSRPMATQEIDFDGDLWFFTRADSAKVHEVYQDRQVNVSFANPEKQIYISASGAATLIRDTKKIEELWKPIYKTFFPQGLEDPELALLKISVHTAEYWSSPSSALGRLFNFAKAYVTKDAGKLGEHDKLTVE